MFFPETIKLMPRPWEMQNLPCNPKIKYVSAYQVEELVAVEVGLQLSFSSYVVLYLLDKLEMKKYGRAGKCV